MEKLEPFCPVYGDVKWYSHCGKTVWKSLKKLKLEISHNPAIWHPLLDKDPKELKVGSQTDTYTLMFITAVIFVGAKT